MLPVLLNDIFLAIREFRKLLKVKSILCPLPMYFFFPTISPTERCITVFSLGIKMIITGPEGVLHCSNETIFP